MGFIWDIPIKSLAYVLFGGPRLGAFGPAGQGPAAQTALQEGPSLDPGPGEEFSASMAPPHRHCLRFRV